MATVPQFAVPRGGEASFWFWYDSTPLGIPGNHKRRDSFSGRSPQGRRCIILVSL